MSGTRIRRAFLTVLVTCMPAVASAALPPSLEATRFASVNRNVETILHVPSLGRYSLSARGAVGASIELVDRMSGTIASASPGTGAGAVTRLDAFLEPADYKVRLSKQPGEAVDLAVARFVTANGGPDETAVPVLADGQGADGELHDLQLCSWWIRVDASNPSIIVEARGRNLEDAALWKDGVWDTGARPSRRTLETQAGRPLTVLEFNTAVEPGLYLLVCAGASRLPWAKESASEPFSVTRGAQFLGETGMMKVTIPERGTTSFLVSGSVGYVQMEVPDTKGYRLMTSPNRPGSSRYDAVQEAAIDAKSASLRCAVRGAGGGDKETSWVTIQGQPGQTVEVRWLGISGAQSWNGLVGLQAFPDSASYLTTAMSAAEGQDSIDATGVILQTTRTQNKTNIEARAVQAVGLSPDKPLRRRINATSRLSFILLPQKQGGYSVAERDSGAAARYQFSLLDDVLTGSGVSPIEVKGGGRIDLKEKLYQVTIVPVKAGILDFAIVPTSLFGRAKTGDIFASAAPAGQNEVWWPSTAVIQGGAGQAIILLGARESIPLGVLVRRLPLEIERTAAVRVDPSKALSLPFTCTRDVRIFSTSPSFGPDTATVDGAPWRQDLVVGTGAHTLVLTNRTSRPEWHVIGAVPPDASSAAPRPRFADVDSLFPSFAEGSPVWRSFDRGETLSFLLKVKTPGSYRVSTAGRLAMGITIRTFLRPSLVTASQNSDGRNAALTAWLRPGTYLVQATAQGASRGRAGVTLEPVPVVPTAPVLSEGATVRATVPGAAVMQTEVKVDREGDFQLECLGLGRSFPYRLEDAEGWPIGAPTRSGILAEHLTAGTYRYISMADPVETRRLVSLSASAAAETWDPKAKKLTLPLNRTWQKTWVEQPGRPEDVFSIELPADIHAVLSLSRGMLFRVLKPDGSPLYQGLGGKPLALELAKGSWRIAVASVEEDNLKKYEIALATEDLFVGESRRVAPSFGTIPISVGSRGTAEIWSYGANELEAALVDESGKLVATGETITDDWNFRIVAGVVPGRYRLFYYSPLAAQAAVLQAGGGRQASPASAPQVSQEDNEEEGQVSQDEDTGDDGGVSEDRSGDESEQDQPADDQSEEAAQQEPSQVDEAQVMVPAPPLKEGSSEIRMIVRAESPLPAVSGTLDTRAMLADEVAVVQLTSRDSAVYRFSGASTTALSVAVLRDGRLLASGASPLFLPLSAGGVYTLRFWRTSETQAPVDLHAGAEKAAQAAAAETVDTRTSVLGVSFPAGASLHLESDHGPLLYSGGADLPFEPLTDAAVSTVSGTGWVVRPDGAPIGACRVTPLRLSGGSAEAVQVGAFEGGFDIEVPPRSVALLRTDNAGRPAGLSASPRASSRPSEFDWRAGRIDSRASVIGLREGPFRGRIWEASQGSEGAAPDRRLVVSAEVYPVVTDAAIGTEERTVAVAPGTAAAFSAVSARLSVVVSLEEGMAAFAWRDGPAGMVDGQDGPITGTLEVSRGSLVVVNRGRAPGLCVIRLVAASDSQDIADGPGFEGVAVAGASYVFEAKSTAAGSRLFAWGAVSQARWLSSVDGRISGGAPFATEIGGVIGFPAGRGRLEVTSAGGPLKVWSAPPETLRAPFVARDPRTAETALPAQGGDLAQGGALAQAAQSWSFSLDAPSIVSVRAGGDGVAGLFDRSGACLRAAASTGADRTILTMLPRGAYSVFTRPFRGASPRAGTVTLRTLAARDLAVDGPGEPSLIGPGDSVLYRFRVTQEGKIGCGIRVQSDGLTATLLDEGFAPLGTGQIFVRTLKPGLYYLLVASSGGTQRYTPVVYGLAGTNMDIPDDIERSYRESEETSR